MDFLDWTLIKSSALLVVSIGVIKWGSIWAGLVEGVWAVWVQWLAVKEGKGWRLDWVCLWILNLQFVVEIWLLVVVNVVGKIWWLDLDMG